MTRIEYNPHMRIACTGRFIRLIVACFAGISFASTIDAAFLSSQFPRGALVFQHGADIILAPGSASTDPAEFRINKTGRAFSAGNVQTDRPSPAAGRFDRNRVLLWLLDRTETDPITGVYFPNLHDRAPPSL